MNREGIKQRVQDVLGIILIDKDPIRDDATFKDLVLDEEDVDELFNMLGNEFGIKFPDSIKQHAVKKPEHLPLPMVVDLIWLMQPKSASDTESDKTEHSDNGKSP